MAVDNEEFEGWDDEDTDTVKYVRDIAEAAGEAVCSLIDYVDTNSHNNKEAVKNSFTTLSDRVLLFMKESEVR